METFDCLANAAKKFTTTIQRASKKFIPHGFRKKYNTNFSPNVARLIKKRNKLKALQSPSPQEKTQINNLNEQINAEINKEKINNWNEIVTNLNHKTSSPQFWRLLQKINNSKNNPPPTHESFTTNKGTPMTNRQQSNTIMKYYSKISFKPTERRNRQIKREYKRLKMDNNQPPPFTSEDVKNTIKSLNKSKAVGPDGVSNLHLKHLGPLAIDKLTSIYNRSVLTNDIPSNWKIANIIPILKPGKSSSDPGSYRPISLLSTLIKTLEKLILKIIQPHLPVHVAQHGFRAAHSTTTLLTSLTQNIANGFNEKQPPSRTVMVAIDINKAFDTTPRHILMQKILRTELPTNYKKWLINFISGRQAHVTYIKVLSQNADLYTMGSYRAPSYHQAYSISSLATFPQ